MAARPTSASCGPSRRRSRAGGPSRRRCSSGRARTAMFRNNDCPPVKLSHKLFSTRLAFVINAVSRVDHSAPAGRVRAGYVSPLISRVVVGVAAPEARVLPSQLKRPAEFTLYLQLARQCTLRVTKRSVSSLPVIFLHRLDEKFGVWRLL